MRWENLFAGNGVTEAELGNQRATNLRRFEGSASRAEAAKAGAAVLYDEAGAAMVRCPWGCGSVLRVRVAGHWQCDTCHRVIESCCD